MRLRIQIHRPRVRQTQALFPFIRLQDWAKFLLAHHPRFLLGGHDHRRDTGFIEMFTRFWERYQELDPTHPVYTHFTPNEYGHIIPYAVRGDEGRGKAKELRFDHLVSASYRTSWGIVDEHEGVPWGKDGEYSILGTAFQRDSWQVSCRPRTLPRRMRPWTTWPPTWFQTFRTLSSGAWRLLVPNYACNTLRDLLAVHASKAGGHRWKLAYVGLIGDWVYLRKWMKLFPGFTSKRVCHHCELGDAWLIAARFD